MDLELKNVSKFFGNFRAVNDVSFGADKGELFSLVGPSGCGKTTTLRMIAGFHMPEQGQITLGGEDITKAPINKRDTAMVFQNYALFPHMTVYDNIAFGLRMKKVDEYKIWDRVSEVLELIQLPDIGKKIPKELSGGMQQRVAIARAIVTHPKVLLLDEPLSNLDAKLREELRMEIRDIQQKVGITTVFVTHDISEAFVMSDKIAVMEKGEIVHVGSPMEIYENPKNEFVGAFVGRSSKFDIDVKAVHNGIAEGVFAEGAAIKFKVNREELVAGDKAKLMVRPERITVSEKPTGKENSYKVEIDRSYYLGERDHYEAFVGDMLITVETPNIGGKRFDKGESCYFEWGVDDNVYFKKA